MAKRKKQSSVDKSRYFLSALVGILGAQSLLFRNLDSGVFDNFSNLADKGLDSIAQVGPVGSAILALGVGVLFYRLYPKFEDARTPSRVISAIVAFFMALSIVIPRLMKNSNASIDSYPNYVGGVPRWHEPIFWAVFIIQLSIISLALTVGICWLMEKTTNINEYGRTNTKTDSSLKRHGILEKWAQLFDGSFGHSALATMAMVLCWMPMLIIQGPAIIDIDTVLQLVQFRTGHVWDPMTMVELPGFVGQDHHPFVDGYLYAIFDKLGILLGNEILGFQILIILQSCVAAFSIVASLIWVRKRTSLTDPYISACWCLAAALPVFPMNTSTVLKDSTWVPIFLLWMVAFFEVIYRCNKGCAVGWKLVTCLIILGVLSGLTKKTSIYITTLSLLLLLIFLRKRIVALLISVLIPAALVIVLVPVAVLPALDIAPGGPQEALSVPIQQLSKVTILHRDELTKSDLKAIDKVLDIDRIKPNWKASSADNAKHYGYKVDSSSKDRLKFVKTWIRLFFRYPKDYITAAPYLLEPFFYGETYYRTGPVRCGWWEAGGLKIFRGYPECKPSYTQEKIAVPLKNALNKIPPFSFLGAEALYVLWVPLLALGLTVAVKRYRNLYYLIPTFVNWCSLLFVPTHQVRYTLSFLFCFVLTIAIPFVIVNSNKGKCSQTTPAKHAEFSLSSRSLE